MALTATGTQRSSSTVERRRGQRHPVAWRVRLWVLGSLGFTEARGVDASTHGVGLVVSPRVPTSFLEVGKRQRVDIEDDLGNRFTGFATIRRVAGLAVGIEVEDAVRISNGAPGEAAPAGETTPAVPVSDRGRPVTSS